MGDLIEGPDRFMSIHSKPKQHSSSEPMPLIGKVFLAGFALFCVLVIGGGVATRVRGERYEARYVGHCFVTAVGAAGKAESASASFENVSLIFPSGNKAKYRVDRLTQKPCSELGLPDG